MLPSASKLRLKMSFFRFSFCSEVEASEKISVVEEKKELAWDYNGLTPSFMLRSRRRQRIHVLEDGSIAVASSITFHGPIKGIVFGLHGQHIRDGLTLMQSCLEKAALEQNAGAE